MNGQDNRDDPSRAPQSQDTPPQRTATRERNAEARREAQGPQRKRTSPPQFLREVRREMRLVSWPTRREVASYSVVVLVTVSLLMAYIFGLDQAFGQFVFLVFG